LIFAGQIFQASTHIPALQYLDSQFSAISIPASFPADTSRQRFSAAFAMLLAAAREAWVAWVLLVVAY